MPIKLLAQFQTSPGSRIRRVDAHPATASCCHRHRPKAAAPGSERVDARSSGCGSSRRPGAASESGRPPRSWAASDSVLGPAGPAVGPAPRARRRWTRGPGGARAPTLSREGSPGPGAPRAVAKMLASLDSVRHSPPPQQHQQVVVVDRRSAVSQAHVLQPVLAGINARRLDDGRLATGVGGGGGPVIGGAAAFDAQPVNAARDGLLQRRASAAGLRRGRRSRCWTRTSRARVR